MKLSLVVLSAGNAEGQAIPIPSAQFIIGRDPQCNLRPASAMISKRHCAVLVKESRVYLRDFGSTNGTFLNDQPVKGEVPIQDGDILKVGPLSFRVTIAGAPVPTKSTPPPPPKKAVMDDDAAAMLLDDDDAQVEAQPGSAETEGAIPAGTTVMEMPALQETNDAHPKQEAPAAAKPAPAPKKPATGAAQDAAKAILEKMAKGRRK
jgi:pSer/pThr/pTyr-binding forkhead associated (FHA) protein